MMQNEWQAPMERGEAEDSLREIAAMLEDIAGRGGANAPQDFGDSLREAIYQLDLIRCRWSRDYEPIGAFLPSSQQ